MSPAQIYLDYAASTPMRPEVVEAMRPYWSDLSANPSAVHEQGRHGSQAVESARHTFAELINADPDEIIFTGCGSESDNLALRGVMWAARAAGRGNHLITSSVEHKAVIETARQLRDLFGFDLTILPVDGRGQVDLGELEGAIRPDTAMISIMTANNEIGTLQPIEAIGKLARDQGVLFHTDAIQAAAVMAWDMKAVPIDLLSFSAHKFYGPKGVGVLYVRQGVELLPALTGGGQENGRRAGTTNVPGIVGAATAFRLSMEERIHMVAHYRQLRDRLIDGILSAMPGQCVLTGHPSERLPNNASFAFKNISGNDILMHLDVAGVAASSGSACLSGDPRPAAVLQAVGLGSEWTTGGLRLSVGRLSTVKEIEYVLEILPGIVDKLRVLAAKFA